MVDIFGQTKSSKRENGTHTIIYRIPAFSQGVAKRRANINSRVKGMDDFHISNIDRVGDGDLPGQGIFEITIDSEV